MTISMTPEQTKLDDLYLDKIISGEGYMQELQKTYPHQLGVRIADNITEEQVISLSDKYNLEYLGMRYEYEFVNRRQVSIFGVFSDDFENFRNDLYRLGFQLNL